MNANKTELIAVLDESGSMVSLQQETIAGFNQFIESQKTGPGEAFLTLVTFNHDAKTVIDNKNVKDVDKLTDSSYYPNGFTALYDTLGNVIDSVGKRLAKTPESERPGKVVVFIVTDGEDNRSREYTAARVRSMVEHQKEKYNWEFIFFGANIDAAQAAQSIGIASSRAVNYSADVSGTKGVYVSFCNTSTSLRAGKTDINLNASLN